MFQLDNISISVPERTLLQDLSLQLFSNKVYGLIGHNGSGKSTLLKLLARQVKPTSGSISLNNRPLSDYSARQYAKHVAYLPQYLPITTSLKAYELVGMGRYAWHGLLGKETKEDKDIILESLQLTHTEQFAEQIVDTLSGGERSRIWLAMCLAQQSQFLLLDEPLAALDIAHQLEVMSLIKRLSQNLGLGVIIVIHDINLAAQFCDELIALKNGKLLKQGHPKDIMTVEVLHDIYQVNMNIVTHPQTHLPIALL